MRLLALLLLTASMAWMQSGMLPEPGGAADGLQLIGADGRRLRWDALTASGPLLMMVSGSRDGQEVCEDAKRLAATPMPEGLTRILALPGEPVVTVSCKGAPPVQVTWIPGAAHAGQWIALIVDDSLHVRLRLEVGSGVAGWEALSQKVARWVQGRQTYEANCGHCHGFDGAQASAPETKSLVGITRKYPEARVLELGSLFGGVDMTGWSDAKKETLLTYLRGL